MAHEKVRNSKSVYFASCADELTLPPISAKRGVFSLNVPCVNCSTDRLIGLFGKSGCGKTTYLQELQTLVGAPLSLLLPQHDDLLNELSARQNIELGILATIFSRKDMPAARKRIESIATVLELTSLLSRQVIKLSGGQRRRVAFARVVAGDTEVLLLDELFNGFGHVYEQIGIDLLLARKAQGKFTIVVSHDLPLLSSFVDRILILDEGELIGQFDPRAPLTPPDSKRFINAVGVTNVLSSDDISGLFDVEAEEEIAEQIQDSIIAFWRDWAGISAQPGRGGECRLCLKPKTGVRISVRRFFSSGQEYLAVKCSRDLLKTVHLQVRGKRSTSSAVEAVTININHFFVLARSDSV